MSLRFIPVMKATLVNEPPDAGDWNYELKFDGFRALALKDGDSVRLLSSNAKDLTGRFHEIAEAVSELRAEQVVLDGEIVALDEEGRSSFALLQNSESDAERPPLAFYVFDLLRLEEEDLTRRPLGERRKQLAKLLRGAPDLIRFSADIKGSPKLLVEEVRKRGLEGIIGKEKSSIYEPGARSRKWIKLKVVGEQELVIGGYTPPEGMRTHFGALLVGYFEKDKFQFAGKVGTGFNQAILKSLHRRMEGMRQDKCPFANLPERKQGKWSQNITPSEMKRCKWVEPQLVCQVRFTEWTRDGKLRHPVFLGLREDKDAREIVRERPS
jgi:bifunctional non-homologous end joining protein LigD